MNLCLHLSAPYVDDVGEVSPVDQAVIDLFASAAVWRVPGFEVDSFVHEVRALDRHLSINRRPFSFVLSCRLYRPIVGW
jgi:hypothetical protein